MSTSAGASHGAKRTRQRCARAATMRHSTSQAYAELLGWYLGDGMSDASADATCTASTSSTTAAYVDLNDRDARDCCGG